MAAGPTEPPAGVPAEKLDELFHGPLEAFTSERNDLAKRLRADGEPEAAAWVKGLKKPTRAAWLVNQLSARKADDVAELLAAGEELREMQEQMLAGSADRDKLREAAAREREGVAGLLKAATALGAEHGAGGQVLDRVGETLQAAAGDPAVAEAIRLGRLTREQRASSLGLVGAATPAPARGGKKGKGKGEDKAEAAAERRAAAEAAKRHKAAEREVAGAERKVERERAAVEKAREALAEREGRLDEAQDLLDGARRRLDRIS
jgi:hypothetical protein